MNDITFVYNCSLQSRNFNSAKFDAFRLSRSNYNVISKVKLPNRTNHFDHFKVLLGCKPNADPWIWQTFHKFFSINYKTDFTSIQYILNDQIKAYFGAQTFFTQNIFRIANNTRWGLLQRKSREKYEVWSSSSVATQYFNQIFIFRDFNTSQPNPHSCFSSSPILSMIAWRVKWRNENQ